MWRMVKKAHTLVGLHDRSPLVCLQIQYEQMACLHSVKQKKFVRGTYLQRNNL